MHFIQVNDDYKQMWDTFISQYAKDGGLLQSWAWGDFQKTLDNKIFRLAGIDENGTMQAAVLIVKLEMHFEYNYLYCPRGPVINEMNEQEQAEFFSEIKKIASAEKSFMIKIDPAWTLDSENKLSIFNYRKSEKEIQPKCRFVIDLQKSEDELLANMKQKTRYNINLAKKHGVNTRISCELADIEPFWQLTKQTAGRDGFKSHPKEHYKKMFEILCASGLMSAFSAEFGGHIIGSNLMAFYGDTAVYLHGASSDMHREVMAPYLLQWEGILAAKRLGLKYYDFGGVNGKTFFNEKWEGISRFKSGFSQETEPQEFIGCYEKIINPVVYSVYKFVKQIRG